MLEGRSPFLSLEITKECPLHCPGCYAYSTEHLGPLITLRELSDYRGSELVTRALEIVRHHRPVHVSIIGGEPLVRYRELGELLPQLDRMGVEVQLVTSAVRPIPIEWRSVGALHVVVSIDGLPPEHDLRRAPATYDRILRHIAGHDITIHCTITRQMLQRAGYLCEFAEFWSAVPEIRKIWFSVYTPQEGEISTERLRPEDRARLLEELRETTRFPKVHLPSMVMDGYRNPPRSPAECTFARLTACYSADLKTRVTPCQFGGKPVCEECGCIASAGMHGLASWKLAGFVPLSSILNASLRLGDGVRAYRSSAPL
jgi:MoaA/NifB/PqqE/SkfB family radical SAM enzyme